ncbi:TetR/AcrR family transcriptional regulator [Streptomyces triticagri]|uniref:TetR/AcrR family transcriptional regulator n=1 Tax=Streptomyces triticagri TaxID=2293568 RepID=A0A372M0I4_9ACTN|nr:TetR/AcrR family transcriptional regulator [Streptomyces triticagri]RFU84391.1 TetR/AcrR family transcriptional regulator [Streptomyces triticagri]
MTGGAPPSSSPPSPSPDEHGAREEADAPPRRRLGKRPGRRPLVDRRRAVDAVADLGFRDITVSSVAQRLGVRPSTLYRYFATREELLAQAVDARFEEPEQSPEQGPGARHWRDCLAAQAWALWEVYARHPGLAQAVTALPTTPPAMTRRIDRTAVRLLDLGFSTEDAVLAVDVIGELALDTFLLGRITEAPDAGDGAGDVDMDMDMDLRSSTAGADRRARVAAAAPLLDPRLRGLIQEAVTAEPRAWFARKLDLVLDGLSLRAPGEQDTEDRGGHGRSVATP